MEMVNGLNRLWSLLFICMAFVLATGCDSEQQPAEVSQGSGEAAVYEGVIVALGDSLTAGLGVDPESAYPAQLQKKLHEDGFRFKVINAGVSGETTSGTLSRLDWVLSQKPEIVILEIGANDGLRGIEPLLVEKNLRSILEKLQAAGAVTVFAGMKMVWNMGEEYTAAFNRIFPKLAEESGALFMPFFLDGVASVASLNRADGIHPNGDGYALIVDNIYPYVVEAIKEAEERKSSKS